MWGHPAPLPPLSSKQPEPADNGAVPPATQEFRANAHTRCPKCGIFPVSSPTKARVVLVQQWIVLMLPDLSSITSAAAQFHSRDPYW